MGLIVGRHDLQKVTSWFSYRSSVHKSHHEGGAWTPILKRIHKLANPKPRRRTVVQQFMHEKPQIVDDAFHALYGEAGPMSRADRLNKRNEVAKRLVSTTYKDMEAELEQRAKETLERESKEWALELDEIEEAEDVTLYVSSTVSQSSATNAILQCARHPFLRCSPSSQTHRTLRRVLRQPHRCCPGSCGRGTILLYVS